jgi:predicted acyltransferase
MKLTARIDLPVSKPKRLISLDALRGFDMFWIISGEGIFHGLANAVKQKHGLAQNHQDWQIIGTENLSLLERMMVGISNQLHHSPWNGFTFYDLIFPLFIFISGVSMPYSYQKYFENRANDKSLSNQVYYSLIKRTLILIVLGFIVNGLLQWNGFENTRFASVLGRIAFSTFFAALIYLNFSLPKQIIWFLAILFGYYFIMMYVPVPHFGAGVLTPEGNLSAYIDRLLLPGKLHRIVYDPEGILSTIPAICSAMIGIFTGTFIKSESSSSNQKVFKLFLAGIVCIALGLLWSIIFPINKTMWTSTFVLFAGGCSILLFTLFYYVIDVQSIKKWCVPFLWIGSNSILIYVCAHGLINFESTAVFIFGGLVQKVPAIWQSALLWTAILGIQLFILKFLYDKKWFLKI